MAGSQFAVSQHLSLAEVAGISGERAATQRAQRQERKDFCKCHVVLKTVEERANVLRVDRKE